MRSFAAIMLGLAALASSACQTSPADPLAANKAVVNRYYQEVWNKHQVDLIDELLSDNFVDNGALKAQEPGREGFRKVVKAVQEGYSNATFTLREMVAEGDRVTTRWTFDATFAPNTYKLTFSGHETWRIAEGKIAERWGTTDVMRLMAETFGMASPIGELPEAVPGVRPSDDDVKAVGVYYDRILNQADYRAFEEVFAEDFIDHSPDPGQTPDLAGFKQSVDGFLDGFLDSDFQIDELKILDDKIEVKWTYTGAFPATKVPVDFTGREVWIARQGKIKERWGEYDLQDLVSDVGLIDAPAEGHESTVRRYYEDVWNSGNEELMDILFSPAFVDHSPDDGQEPGLEGFKKALSDFRSRFKEPKYTIDELTAKEDKVSVKWKVQGKFLGMMPVTFQGVETWTVRDGRITERWAEYDHENLGQRVGGQPPR